MMGTGYRFEFKYPISKNTARILQKELILRGMEHDLFASKFPSNSYRVTSLYFDNPSLADYYDKEAGLLVRKKVRARIYEPYLKESRTVWLELKQKHNTMIKKKRIPLSREEWNLLTKGRIQKLLKIGRDVKKQENLEKILFYVVAENMTPRTVTTYNRVPFIYNYVEQIRITFDTNLEACDRNDLCYTQRHVPVMVGDEVIMELKFETILPSWLKAIITNFGLTRSAYSKYTKSVEATRRHMQLRR